MRLWTNTDLFSFVGQNWQYVKVRINLLLESGSFELRTACTKKNGGKGDTIAQALFHRFDISLYMRQDSLTVRNPNCLTVVCWGCYTPTHQPIEDMQLIWFQIFFYFVFSLSVCV